MPNIVSADIADVSAQLPQLAVLDGQSQLPHSIDLLIASAGFEDRAQAIVSDLQGKTVKKTVAITYPTNVADNADAQRRFVANLAAQPLQYVRGRAFHNVRSLVESIDPTSQIVIDLSGMASYVIYPALAAVFKHGNNRHRLAIYYAEAESYSPNFDEWTAFLSSVQSVTDPLEFGERYRQSYFQAKGVQDVYESDVFPGANKGGLRSRIVAMPSFSLERMRAMLAHVQSLYGRQDDDTVWFLGDPPDHLKHGWRLEALDRLYNLGSRSTAVSTLQYKDVLCRLQHEWTDFNESSHLLIASCGSKMQHLGTLLFLAMHPECGLVLSEPKEFLADRYSSGVGARWLCDFGEIGRVRALLSSLDTLRFQW